MNWYKNYRITVIKSMKSGEAYCAKQTVGDFEIDKNWNKSEELKNDYKVIYHKTFGFLLTSPIDEIILKRCLENIEKLYLLSCTYSMWHKWHKWVNNRLGIKRSARQIDIEFIRPEGCEFKKATSELVEDIADLNLDKELEEATKNKEIYFFERLRWEIIQRQTFNPGDVIIKVRSRFNFLVLEKDVA